MSNPYETPKHPTAEIPSTGGDSTGGLIPYKNQPALIAYYLAIFGMFPCIGIVLSVPAFVLGIMGLQKKKRQPEVKGSIHAWIGIILGGSCTIGHLIGWTAMIAGIVAENSR